MDELRIKMKSDILQAYGSLDRPRYDFVLSRYNRMPYSELQSDLGSICSVAETSDLNYDVAVILFLESERWRVGLCLSLIGPYACITDSSGRARRCDEIADDETLAQLRGLLNKHSVTIVGAERLNETITLAGQSVSLARILFSSAETPRP